MKLITIASTLLLLFTITTICASAAAIVEQPSDCVLCGMNRTTFAHSRALVEYQDGTKTGSCSINCALISLKKNQGKKLKSIKVADYNSRKLIDATTATWVIGGDLDGVMTPVAKWAFARKVDAQQFNKKHGGWLAPYKEVYQAVLEELELNGRENKQPQHKHNH